MAPFAPPIHHQNAPNVPSHSHPSQSNAREKSKKERTQDGLDQTIKRKVLTNKLKQYGHGAKHNHNTGSYNHIVELDCTSDRGEGECEEQFPKLKLVAYGRTKNVCFAPSSGSVNSMCQ
eukprot:1016930_1